jgi:hypothetical protein
MNSTICPGGHGKNWGLVPGFKIDPKYFKLLKILQVQSDTLWQNYSFQRVRITLDKRAEQCELTNHLKKYPLKTVLVDSSVNEVYLFHGTTREIAETIASKGFDTRLGCQLVTNRLPNGMFGSAVYFAESFSKSNQYVACPLCNGNSIGRGNKDCNCSAQDIEKAGGYVMIVGRVLLGDSHICLHYDESTYKFKEKPPQKPDGSYYDSIFAESRENFPDHHLSYREFVVYEPAQIYPEFLIYYTRHSSPPSI